MRTIRADSYAGFADLAKQQVRGIDYEIKVRRRPASSIAVIAPHGGRIERGTSDIARGIAGEDFNLYLFEGIKLSGSYAALHLTSSHFDEPLCLGLIARCSLVVAVHVCKGSSETVLMGGLDYGLKTQLAGRLKKIGVEVETHGHRYPATDPDNICNRGKLAKGVQLELTPRLRSNAVERGLVDAVRSVLLSLDPT
ncbi:MAG: poly-gamma-glutamate hydrolase family protein [Gammaproteobacteria bacterium]